MTKILNNALTVKQAASVAGVSKDTIYNWIYRGILASTQTATNRHSIDPTDLELVLKYKKNYSSLEKNTGNE